jgi:hypothetical protein
MIRGIRNCVPIERVVFAVAIMCCGIVISGAPPDAAASRATQEQKKAPAKEPTRVYEDEEVRILILAGWKVLKAGSPDDPLAAHPPAVSQTLIPSPGRGLLLSSMGYTLTLAYNTGHASPIKGGRFPEVFSIPWLEGVSDPWAFGDSLRKIHRRTGNEMRFINLILDNPSSQVRGFCGLPEDSVSANRWFAGYFTTANGGWFFQSEGAGCPEKAYTLTSSAKIPAELPDADDPILKRVISEAIDIVASIHYKRCPPAHFSDSH